MWNRYGGGQIEPRECRVRVVCDVLEKNTIKVRADEDGELELKRDSGVEDV